MTDPEHDELFEEYLQRRSAHPALDDKLEPPAALDAMVLNRARQAIQPATAAKPQPQRAPRWAVPVALAATLLLCLSVLMNISINTRRPSRNAERAAAAHADVKASALSNATAQSNAAGVSDRISRDRSATSNGEHRESVSGTIESNEVVLPEAKVADAPVRQPPIEAEAPAAPAAATASATDKAVQMAEKAGVTSPEYTPPRMARAAAGQRAEPETGSPHPADPKVWLQQIRALRAVGKIDQADAEMRRFRSVFPHYEAGSAAPVNSDLPK